MKLKKNLNKILIWGAVILIIIFFIYLFNKKNIENFSCSGNLQGVGLDFDKYEKCYACADFGAYIRNGSCICNINTGNIKGDSEFPKCKTCPTNAKLDGNSCRCPSGTAIVNGKCEKCPSGQGKLRSSEYCGKCPNTFTIINNQCTCPKDQGILKNGICGKCPAGQVLFNNGTCDTCSTGEGILNGKCVKCKSKEGVKSDGTCGTCPKDQGILKNGMCGVCQKGTDGMTCNIIDGKCPRQRSNLG